MTSEQQPKLHKPSYRWEVWRTYKNEEAGIILHVHRFPLPFMPRFDLSFEFLGKNKEPMKFFHMTSVDINGHPLVREIDLEAMAELLKVAQQEVQGELAEAQRRYTSMRLHKEAKSRKNQPKVKAETKSPPQIQPTA